MTTSHTELHDRRLRAVQAWTAFVEGGDAAADAVRPEILSSWERSGSVLTPAVSEAPLADEADTASYWKGSPLQVAVERIGDDLRSTAEDGDLVVAVTDADTRILWTYGGRVMRRKAETVNFVAGGRWDEASVGTNALALASRSGQPSMVFSAEHYAAMVHQWVCWAAPVHDPVTGAQIGVIDLSTTWDRTHPIGLATARMMARLIETAIPLSAVRHPRPTSTADEPGLVLTLLGAAETRLDGARLLLNRRQTEILALLALHPEGLSSEQLHTLLYGDKSVTLSTLKAEVSHLRSALGGSLSSRPYRLALPVRTDVEQVLGLIRRGDVAGAVEAYGGDLLPGRTRPRWWTSVSSSPWRCASRCSPIRSPRSCCATASGRRTTSRWSSSRWPGSVGRHTRPGPCSGPGWRRPVGDPRSQPCANLPGLLSLSTVTQLTADPTTSHHHLDWAAS